MEDSYKLLKREQDARIMKWNSIAIVFGVISFLFLFVKNIFFTVLFGTQAFKNLAACSTIPGYTQPLEVLSLQAQQDPSLAA